MDAREFLNTLDSGGVPEREEVGDRPLNARTNSLLPNAYNFDVTALDPAAS